MADQSPRSSTSEQDLYGFEEVLLPPLPSGARLSIDEAKPMEGKQDSPATSFEDKIEDCVDIDAEMYRKVSQFIAQHDRDDAGSCGVGGEVWPAAAALCTWLSEHAAEIRGAHVLELGSGTGVCGLYAAALGASSVTLTDGGSDDLLELARSNVEMNRNLMPRDSTIR